MTVDRRRCRECGGPRHPRTFVHAPPERQETLLDGVKAFLTLILVCGAFWATVNAVASLQVVAP